MKNSWIKMLFSFAKRCRGKMLLAVFFSMISVTGGIVPFFGIYGLLDAAITERLSTERLVYWMMICAAGFLIQIAGFAISTTFAHVSAYTILEQIRLQMAEKLLHLSLGDAARRPIGQMKDIILDKVGTIELPLAHVIPEAGASLILPIVMFLYIITIDWRMALSVLATLPVCMLPVLDKKARTTFNEKYAAYMEANDHVNNVIVEYIEGIEVVKAFNQTSTSYKKYSDAIQSFREFTMDWYRSSWKSLTMMSSVLPSTLLVTAPMGLWLFIRGELTAAEMILCCILALGLISPLIKLTTYINMGKSIEYALVSANEILSMKEMKMGKKEFIPENVSIDLEHVTFSYEESMGNVIQDLSLHIPQGKVTAFVGPSGGGKSTVARLIDRFWDVKEGRILIGGVDIRDMTWETLSGMISFVTQDNYLFHCSLKENIRIGKFDASEDEVRQAAMSAMCDEFINLLPNGYDTSAGEAGKLLSGGEKQRIALARTMLKNSPIMILDEATAFADPQNEAQIQTALRKIAKGKTLLVIAHRLSTIQHADQIVVLNHGKIEAVGTHEELLIESELYHSLWNAHISTKGWAVRTGKET